jgi:hypothetical protein
MEDNAAKWL